MDPRRGKKILLKSKKSSNTAIKMKKITKYMKKSGEMSFSSKHSKSDFSKERLDDHSPSGEIMCEKECSPNSKKVLTFDKSAQEQTKSELSTDNNVQSESPVLKNYETKLNTMNMDVNKSEDTDDQKSVRNNECSYSKKEGHEINQNVRKNVPEEILDGIKIGKKLNENQVLNEGELKLSADLKKFEGSDMKENFSPEIVPETDFNDELQQTNKIICAEDKATLSCETELCSSENIQKDMREKSNAVPKTLAQSTDEDIVSPCKIKSEVIDDDSSDTAEEEDESYEMKVKRRRTENVALLKSLGIHKSTSAPPSSSKKISASKAGKSGPKKRRSSSGFVPVPTRRSKRLAIQRLRAARARGRVVVLFSRTLDEVELTSQAHYSVKQVDHSALNDQSLQPMLTPTNVFKDPPKYNDDVIDNEDAKYNESAKYTPTRSIKPSKIVEKRENFFGPVPGVAVGTEFVTRMEASHAGVHRPPVAGIHGNAAGCYSIALSGGYEDDVDSGYSFMYTGEGGRNLRGTATNPKNLRTAPQSKDQVLERGNLALVKNFEENLPVRVLRGYKLQSEFAPESGYRYDGLYKVENYFLATGASGFKVYKFVFRRLDNQEPAPWLNRENEDPDIDTQQESSQPDIVQLPEQESGEQNNDQLQVQESSEEINGNLQAQESSELIDEKLPLQENSDITN